METIHIEYYNEFIVLAEELNFHAAAERLHVSQSALSKHIAELERHHDIQLLERGRTSVKLTAKGAVFLERACDLYERYQDMMSLFSGSDGEEKPLAVAGVLDNPLDFPLVSRAFEYCQQKGLTRLPVFIPCDSSVLEENMDLMRTGEADCAILFIDDDRVRELPDAENFLSERISHVPLDAIVRRDHPLAGKSFVTLEDFEGQTLVRLVGPRFTSGWSQLETQLANAGIHVSTKLVPTASAYEYITGDPDDAILLAQRAPSFATPMQNANAVRVPVRDDRLVLGLTVIYPVNDASPQIAPFVESLRQSFSDAYAAGHSLL